MPDESTGTNRPACCALIRGGKCALLFRYGAYHRIRPGLSLETLRDVNALV